MTGADSVSLSTLYAPEAFESLQKAAELLIAAKSIVIASHYNPDADAYGSSCGLAEALKQAGRKVVVLNSSGIIDAFRFIPGVPEIQSELSKTPSSEQLEVLCVCDCGDLERIGEGLVSIVSRFKNVINIDHHASNTRFGTINVVREGASSASEIVHDLLTAAQLPIDQRTATALFSGIMADSGSFRYLSTTAHTLECAAGLVRLGAQPAPIAEALFSGISLGAIRLQSRVLLAAQFHADGKVCELVATQRDFEESGCKYDEADGLVEKGREIAGVVVSVFMRWDGSIWRISLRSRTPQCDVSEVARQFGGGGHKVAAAFRYRSDLESLRSALIPKLTEVVCRKRD